MTALPNDARRVLELVGDDWKMQPSEYHPGAIMRDLKVRGFVRIKRERPHPGSPFRIYLKRSEEGRRELGLEERRA